MQAIIFILIGVAGGVLGGMGMGGGTLLIPLLVTFTSMQQHSAQAVNLIAFIPMAIIVLFVHIKNGLVKPKYLLTISLPATILGVLLAFAVRRIPDDNLRRYFGVFLIVLGIYQLVSVIIKIVKDANRKNKGELLTGCVQMNNDR